MKWEAATPLKIKIPLNIRKWLNSREAYTQKIFLHYPTKIYLKRKRISKNIFPQSILWVVLFELLEYKITLKGPSKASSKREFLGKPIKLRHRELRRMFAHLT